MICSRYDFEDLPEAVDTFNRWLVFYNYERIHSGINYLSPYNYLVSLGIDIAKEIELKKAFAKEPHLEDLNRNTVQYLGG